IVTGPDGAADGAAELVARLPAAQAAACWHALDHHARGRRADGDDRTITQLMADTLVERLTGITAATGPPPPAAHIHIVIKATTLTGHDDHPAQLAGHGPLTADTARTIAHNATARWRRLVVDDTGHALTIDRTTRTGTTPSPITDWLRRPIDWTPPTTTATDRRTYTGTLRGYLLARDGHCRMPTCTTKITDADHITPHHTGGRTTANNGQGLSTRCHHLRDLPRWHLHGTADHTIWTTPTGHHYHSYPPPALGWASEPP
ncbi:MAG: HNH endonuclease, partial [Nocardioidaceae bacterium]|nr:HNH endonuclease [Nocardioidaceae bacterium]